MTPLGRIPFILVLTLLSCTTKETSTEDKSMAPVDTISSASIDTSIPVVDSFKRFTVDDYPVTDQMLNEQQSNHSKASRKSGNVTSNDKAWFTNDALEQTLVLELYTDNHRLISFHFYNNDIPDSIVDRIYLEVNKGPASLEEKKASLNGFIRSAAKIDKKYFITDKGFQLGDSKDKALSVYGKPDQMSISGAIEKVFWDFRGDADLIDSSFHPNTKPLAGNSFGHQTTMFFRNGKLIGLIFHNEIP